MPDTERVTRIIAHAERIWRSREDAMLFLGHPHPLLEGRRPIDLARESAAGACRVDQLLGRIESGVAP